MNSSDILIHLSNTLASATPSVDSIADHDRWQAGIGPFEEENQIEMLRAEIDEDTPYSIETEKPYLDGGQRADLFIKSGDTKLPIEAKLLRFRYDNGNIDPNSFARIFTPFPEGSSLLTDAQKLHQAGFEEKGGLLGLYYEPVDESYNRMSPEAIAEKFALDVDYWYDFEVETREIAHFDGLRHPVHQQGAIITWEIVESM
jgi:hypothetical protein